MSKLNIVKTLRELTLPGNRNVLSTISLFILCALVIFLLMVFPQANAQELTQKTEEFTFPSVLVTTPVQPKNDVTYSSSTRSMDLIQDSVETQINAQSIIIEEVATTTTTTIPVVAPYKSSKSNWICPQWHQTALDVGWPQEQLSKLSYVIYRESRCNPDSHNPDDPMGGSNGLVQINQFWCKPTKYWPNGWLQSHDVLTSCDELYDPQTNLSAALMIWYNSGWSPWAM